MDIIELTKKLISIPSYVDEKNNETEIGNYIYGFLKKSCPGLRLEIQRVERGRFNIIARDAKKPRLLFVNHLDTVEPRSKKDQLKTEVKSGRLYGLGAVDRKGGIAALLTALKNFSQTAGLMLLFYVDEEYDLKGMKKFVEECQVKPMLVVGCESNFEIVNGCRGLIEIAIQITGSSGHSARPASGKNAIEGLYLAVEKLKKEVRMYKNKTFGETTLNLAYLKGGVLTREGRLAKQGNSIPDFAEAIIEIRPAINKITAKSVIGSLKRSLSDYKIRKIKTRHDLKGYLTEKGELTELEKAIKEAGFKVRYRNLSYRGYSDLAMLNQKFKVACANFGPKGGNKHKGDEYVEIEDLDRCRKIYAMLIRQMCT